MRAQSRCFLWSAVLALGFWEPGHLAGAQAQPQFTAIQRLTNGEAFFRLSAPTGAACRVDISADLQAWQPLLTLSSAGTNQHTDGGAPYWSRRFYRAEQLPGTNDLTGEHLVTANGSCVVHPLFHATFVMSWNEKMIYVDPDDGINYQGLRPADLILVTHGHNDHLNTNTVQAVRAPGVIIIAPQAVYNGFAPTLRGLTKVLANGATTNVLDLTIEAVPAYNGNHPRGQGNGYVLTAGGKRIHISGDTGDTPELRALPDIDLAFLCMNVPYTMTIDVAASAVRAFRPKVVYPYHLRNQDGSFANVEGFKRQVGTDLGIEVRLRKWY